MERDGLRTAPDGFSAVSGTGKMYLASIGRGYNADVRICGCYNV